MTFKDISLLKPPYQVGMKRSWDRNHLSGVIGPPIVPLDAPELGSCPDD